MAFPEITFKVTNTDVPAQLKLLAQQKFSTLEKFIGDVPTLCEVEFEKETAHQHGDFFRVEANLEVNGKLYRAESKKENFEKAIDEVRDQLDKELRRSNKKQDTLFRRGGQKIKDMLRFGA